MLLIFYFAIPPDSFVKAADCIKKCAMKGSTRIVVEKPHGKDLESSNELSAALAKLFTEKQLYRIDHYLGKEMAQNIMAMRFANVAFETVWNRHYINAVQIDFQEDFGAEVRDIFTTSRKSQVITRLFSKTFCIVNLAEIKSQIVF